MIGAKMFLKLIKNQMETQLKIKVNSFSILHNVTDNKLKFIVGGKEYPYNNESLMSTIKGGVTQQFKDIEGATIDRILIEYKDESPVTVLTFFTDSDGNKHKQEKTI